MIASVVRAWRKPQTAAAWAGLPSFLLRWQFHQSPGNDDTPGGLRESADELACLDGVLPAQTLRWAAQRAEGLGVGADRVLIAAGFLSERAYLRCLARHLEMAIDDLAAADLAASPLTPDEWLRVAELGILPVRRERRVDWVIAPRRLAARNLCRLIGRDPGLRRRIRLSEAATLERCVLIQGRDVWIGNAVGGLARRFPWLSSAPRAAQPSRLASLARAALTAGLLIALPVLAPAACGAALAILFVAFAAFRLIGCLWPRGVASADAEPGARPLPDYSLIVALYREASSVPALLAALEAIDYPPEKLDIVFVLEADDLQTRAALARQGLRPHCRIVIAPEAGPKTKPKALNCALPLIRGRYVAVFDAEDRPEPDQLRKAVAAFEREDRSVACLQAALSIDNIAQSWLSRIFTAEYAGQFDVFLPGLSAMRCPLPLGGTSNHFRTDVLRAVGGWDPYNVTEDADLGFRLARFGYRSVTLSSSTFEEAPTTLPGWLRQRTRWMKGWIPPSSSLEMINDHRGLNCAKVRKEAIFPTPSQQIPQLQLPNQMRCVDLIERSFASCLPLGF